MINYDLPWNPMRIGPAAPAGAGARRHDLQSDFNLSCNETIEAHVLDSLARKIRMFELVIGELDMILGNVEGAKSFEYLLREAWETAASEDDLRQRIGALGDMFVRARPHPFRPHRHATVTPARLPAAVLTFQCENCCRSRH